MFNKKWSSTAALGVTKFMAINDVFLLILCCALRPVCCIIGHA
jgi:hypothetical protein